MSQATLRRTISHIGPLQIAIIVLAVVTGLIHLYRGIMMSLFVGHFAPPPHPGANPAGHFPPPPGGPSILMLLPLPLPVLFYLNFLGYIVLAAALYLPLLRQYQRVIRWTLIVYAAITILLWVLITNAQFNLLAYIDKPIELALINLLLIEDQRVRVARG